MKIKVVAVGKLKDDFILKGVNEYAKRLSRYCDFKIVEVGEENFTKTPNSSEIERIKKLEGENIAKELSGLVVVMDIAGKSFDSESFSKKLSQMLEQNSNITFVIGGSYGISDLIKSKANFRLSFSPMTFPHGLFRLMLTEQIYRAFTIKEGTPYHK